MEKSVINSNLVFTWVALLCLIPILSFSFQKSVEDDELYSIICSSFNYSNENKIKLNNKTMAYESWMDGVWSNEVYDNKGAGFCVFEESELEDAFERLRINVKNLTEKKLLKKKLEDRFILKSNEKIGGIMVISEPVIIGNYSFIFRKTQSTKSLYVQKLNTNGKWDYECGVTIQGELH